MRSSRTRGRTNSKIGKELRGEAGDRTSSLPLRVGRRPPVVPVISGCLVPRRVSHPEKNYPPYRRGQFSKFPARFRSLAISSETIRDAVVYEDKTAQQTIEQHGKLQRAFIQKLIRNE